MLTIPLLCQILNVELLLEGLKRWLLSIGVRLEVLCIVVCINFNIYFFHCHLRAPKCDVSWCSFIIQKDMRRKRTGNTELRERYKAFKEEKWNKNTHTWWPPWGSAGAGIVSAAGRRSPSAGRAGSCLGCRPPCCLKRRTPPSSPGFIYQLCSFSL